MSSQTDVVQRRDWAGRALPFALAWGLPIAVLVSAIFIAPPLKTWLWFITLLWMGIACFLNALRCGRTHCYFTAPFFIAMAFAALLHGYEILWLGPEGWRWLGLTLGLGSGLLLCLPEYLWGRFIGRG